jgi:glyoxalase family protein
VTRVLGIHHVTAIASDPQRNLDFYAGILGLRLVKRTVNFDDPQTYHFYFGDGIGSPGSLLTFFPWPGARRGRAGAGQVAVTSFAAPAAATGFWLERLMRHAIAFEGPAQRRIPGSESESVIAFRDPDGLMLEIVGTAAAARQPSRQPAREPGWAAAGVPAEHALSGIHAVAMWVDRHEASERLLVETLGMRLSGEEESTRRFVPIPESAAVPTTGHVDVRAVAGFPRGAEGAGTVHHVAWRVADEAAQLAVREAVIAAGQRPTPVIDRTYFRSVYFREPGGVLFELATDGPGFAIDEPASRLGERLMLPPQYESARGAIEAALPPLRLPGPEPTDPGEVEASADPSALRFTHRYLPPEASEGQSRVTLLMLHGTGGNEEDLLPLGRMLLPKAGLLSPRGPVLENGMPRFFRRIAEGVFDLEDLARRTADLADFIRDATSRYRLDPKGIVAVGFSNGANIAGSLLLRDPGLLRGAVLLAPMVPFEPDSLPDLSRTAVLIGAGRSDPIAPPEQVERLVELLEACGAEVTVEWHPGGHVIAPTLVSAARRWIAELSESTGAGDRG